MSKRWISAHTAFLLFPIFCSPLCAIANGDDAAKIIFDAANNQYVTDKKPMSEGVVSLEIININTLHYKYSVSAKGADYYSQTVPDALSALLRKAKPVDKTIDIDQEVAKTLARYGANEGSEFTKMQQAIAGMNKAAGACSTLRLEAIRADINNDNKLIETKYEMPLSSVISSLKNRKLTNSDVRTAIGSVCGDGQCDQSRNIKAVKGVFKGLEDSHHEWALTYAAWAKACGTSGDDDKDGLLAKYNLVNYGLDADYKKLGVRESAIINNQVVLSNINDHISDDAVFPDVISRKFRVSGIDEISISIKSELTVPSFDIVDPSTVKNPLNEVSSVPPVIASTSYSLTKRVRGRWVYDFSAGVGRVKLARTKYYLDSSGNIAAGAQDNSDVSIAALAHLYKTGLMTFDGGGYASIGPSLGIMSTEKLSLLLGITAVVEITPRVRLFYTYGRANTKVTQLDGYAVGDSPFINDIPTADRSRTADFNALTLSFTF